MSAHVKVHVKLQFIVPRLCKKTHQYATTGIQTFTPLFITCFPNVVLDPSLVIYMEWPKK